MTDQDKRRNLRGGVHKDHAGKKRYPNSIVGLFRGIYRDWLDVGKPDEQRTKHSIVEFLEKSSFSLTYFKTLKRFPGVKGVHGQAGRGDRTKETTALTAMLEGIGSASKSTKVEYFHIRAMADYLQISEAGFLTAARLCSLERRVDDETERKATIIEYLAAQQRVIDAAIEMVSAPDFPGFCHEAGVGNDGKEIWVSDMAALKVLVDAHNATDMSSYRAAMSRD